MDRGSCLWGYETCLRVKDQFASGSLGRPPLTIKIVFPCIFCIYSYIYIYIHTIIYKEDNTTRRGKLTLGRVVAGTVTKS